MNIMRFTTFAVSALIACSNSSSTPRNGGALLGHCEHTARIAEAVDTALQGAARDRAVELARALNFGACASPGAALPRNCIVSKEPSCQSTAIREIVDGIPVAVRALPADAQQRAFDDHCSRAAIFAQDTAALPPTLDEAGLVTLAAFAVTDVEACGASDNLSSVACYLAGDIDCLRRRAGDAAKKLSVAK